MHAWAQMRTLNRCGYAKVLRLIFTVLTGEVLHISAAPRCSSTCVKAGFVATHRSPPCSVKRCMVSGLAALKQWSGSEGGLLLSEGLRQTVTQQPQRLSASHGPCNALQVAQ